MIVQDARFSEDGTNRFELSRIWNEAKGLVLFVGLNPSKAGRFLNDMTVRKGIGFAQRWGLGGTLHGNVYPLISTEPDLLTRKRAEIQMNIPENDLALVSMAQRARLVVLAWGKFEEFSERFQDVAALLRPYGPKCLGWSAGGFPRHISRIPYSTQLTDWIY